MDGGSLTSSSNEVVSLKDAISTSGSNGCGDVLSVIPSTSGTECQLSAATKALDDSGLNLGARRRLDQQVSKRLIVDRENPVAVYAVMVQKPSRKQKGCALVAFPKGLRASDSRCQLGGGHNGIDFIADGIDRPREPSKVVGFIEPFVVLTDCLVDCDSEVNRGQPQWSRR